MYSARRPFPPGYRSGLRKWSLYTAVVDLLDERLVVRGDRAQIAARRVVQGAVNKRVQRGDGHEAGPVVESLTYRHQLWRLLARVNLERAFPDAVLELGVAGCTPLPVVHLVDGKLQHCPDQERDRIGVAGWIELAKLIEDFDDPLAQV